MVGGASTGANSMHRTRSPGHMAACCLPDAAARFPLIFYSPSHGKVVVKRSEKYVAFTVLSRFYLDKNSSRGNLDKMT